jgi:hypothetical protein
MNLIITVYERETPINGTLERRGPRPLNPGTTTGGARAIRVVSSDVSYRDGQGSFTLATLDAPVISAGRQALMDLDNKLPGMTGGVHVSLVNNTWGTNYVMWINNDMRFRFVLRTT